MIRRKVAAIAVALVVLFAGRGVAHAAAVSPEGQAPQAGATVVPRTIDFSSLPRLTVPYTGPLIERPEAIFEEAEEELERLKQNPAVILPSQLSQFTLDASSGGAQVLAPVVGTGFEGITPHGFIPSEPTVAAGPLNIFTAGNVTVTVTNKDGSNRVETNGRTFFGVTSGEGDISDAQCYYDAVHGRFVALAFTIDTTPVPYSSFYLAVSQTTDARGLWYLYKFDMSKDGTNQTSNWGDYQALGISEDKIAFTSQQFRFSDNSYAYQKIRIIDRVLAYSGASLSFVDFVQFNAPSGLPSDVFVTKAGRNLTAGDNTIHCLCVRTNGGSNVTYRTVTGPPSAPVLSAGFIVPVSPYSAPPDAIQKGTSFLITTNDCRPPDFYIRNGVLICAWHTSITIGGTGLSGIRMLRLRTSDHAVLTDETYGAAGAYCYFPAVTVDSAGTIFLGFGRSGTTEFPSAYATGKRRNDAALQSSVLLKAGLALTNDTRWGDYTGIDNDASLSGPGGSSAWYAGQWVKSGGGFGTWINRLSYSYGQISGTVTDDCDGVLGTTGDRQAAAGVTVTLMQGATAVATTATNASGSYTFGYLESGTYDVVVTPPGGAAVDAIAGSGATSQTRISASDIQLNLTDTQTALADNFIVSSAHAVPAIASVTPPTRVVGSGAFTLTVSGSNFTRCSTVQLDGSNRVTTFVSASQLTAVIPGSDQTVTAIHNITVVTPAPAGGTSNAQTLTVLTGTDVTAPVVTVTSPTGGESWPVGSARNITWSATDNIGVANVDIAYSTNGGASFPNAIALAIPNTGSYAWTVPGTPSTTTRVRVRARDADGNIAADSSHANFTISGWTVTASAGPNGVISPAGTIGVPDGATPSFTITPNTGYAVQSVLVNDGSVGAVTSYAFPAIHANQTIAATFVIKQYTLNVTAVGSGTVSKSPDLALYDHGTVVTLTANPTAGASLLGWSGDTTSTTNPLVFVITNNKNFTATFYQHIYTWTATGSAVWGTAANWTPARTAPAADDVLQFTNGGTVTVTGVTTQTIGTLAVANNTSVSLVATGIQTLTIAGAAGTDLSIAAGSALRLTGAGAITIALPATATASISGSFDALGSGHRFSALGPNAIEFQSGSVVTLGASLSGSVFGTGTGVSALNSVVFHSGSLLAQSAGGTPFGATSPASVLSFEPGSRFRLDNAVATPSIAGRVYADYEHNTTSSVTATGATAFRIDSLIVSKGSFNLNSTGGGQIRGNITVKSGGTLGLNPSSATNDTLSGSSTQTITVQGNLNTTSFANIVINNPSGIVLANNLTISGGLTFSSGRLTTGANVLGLNASGTIAGASQSNGYVDGSLRLNFATDPDTGMFNIGDAADYTPLTVIVSGTGSPFDITALTHTQDHPNIATSGLDADRSVNRYWTLTPSASPTFSNFTATFSYRASHVDAAADPSSFLVRRYNGAWFPTTIGARTATSTQAGGLTDFGDFIVADPPAFPLTVNIAGLGSVAKSPDLVYYPAGSSVQLTATPSVGWSFANWSGDAAGASNPLAVVMNVAKTVTGNFTDIVGPAVVVTAPNGGESFLHNSTTNVTWTATDDAAITGVDVLLSYNGSAGPFAAVASGLANTGTYVWTVPDTGTTRATIEVLAHSAQGLTGADVSDTTFTIVKVVGVESGPVVNFALAPVHPNPVRNGALLSFALPVAASARLSVLDLQGREVLLLSSGYRAAGRYEVRLEGGRQGLSPGLYFARLQVAGHSLMRRFVITR